MKRQGFIYLLITAVIMVMAACGGGQEGQNASQDNTGEKTSGGSNQEQEPLQVYTTLFAWQDLTEKIGGDQVEVTNIVPAGADLHSYEPTSQTMIDMAESDLFIMNGAGMEGFAEAVNDTMEEEGIPSLEVASSMNLLEFSGGHNHSHSHSHDHSGGESGGHSHDHSSGEGGGHSHSHGSVDPHAWLDPVRAQEAVDTIKSQLIELRPEQENLFEENASELKNSLSDLDEKFSQLAESAGHNRFIVSHAAYGYWEDRYGLEQISVSGLAPSSEPSQKELQNIISTVESEGIEHVMFEQNVTSKVTEVIQDEVGAEALQLHNLSVRTEEEIQNNQGYFDLMQQNLDNLQTALEGAAANPSSSSNQGGSTEETEGNNSHNHDHSHDHSH
ncbi:metal ABC transporter solute-binding protein, Zn/Mn family [Salibacterium qingdaonense]|uniref:Zinc transport system substrate-binding protein n=1 Tax=Salibacterium qingdaonense TaxID=266892 RepID=A0A1I4KKJ8_9BACI|nr:zinc ABC transporter substrate-binding protein [Salibacterium qingdaonense]SFL79310.1 zinc transport system substrate-binding protein [Salibacterium qingdaonense]